VPVPEVLLLVFAQLGGVLRIPPRAAAFSGLAE